MMENRVVSDSVFDVTRAYADMSNKNYLSEICSSNGDSSEFLFNSFGVADMI